MILERVSDMFMQTGYEEKTMKEIAEELSIERRTLYSYYPGKLDLVIDAFLYSVERFTQEFWSYRDRTLQQVENLDIRNKLRILLEKHAEFLIQQHSNGGQLMEYDSFMRGVDRESENFKRFIRVRELISHRLELLNQTIREGMQEGNIHTNLGDPDSLALTMEQSLRAYVIKTNSRRGYTDHYTMENVSLFIQIMVQGVLKEGRTTSHTSLPADSLRQIIS